MPGTEDKVKFGIRNAHYAVATAPGVYGDVKACPGMRSVNLTPKGETSSYYADDMIYYQSSANQGYDMEMEITRLMDEFKQDVLGYEKEEETNLLVEKRDAKFKEFAFGFEIEGDQQGRLCWIYNITASRPETSAETTEEEITPQTDTVTCVAAGLPDSGVVQIVTTAETPETVRSKWFEKVRMPGDGVGE